MDELKTEEEQLEEMRAWWSENKNLILGGAAVMIAGIFGWNTMQQSEVAEQVESSALYDTLADHVVDGNLEEAEAVAAQIRTEYSGSAYEGQSKLAMARLYMDQNRDEDAATALRDLLALDDLVELKQVARVRLAKILLYQGKMDEALSTVDVSSMQAFAARFAEVRGDILVAMERYEDARAAYEEALEQPNASQTVDTAFLRLKIFDLPAEVDDATVADVQEEGSAE